MEEKEVLLGVTGGIACYKSLEILRRLKDNGLSVSVVMTESAQQFVQPLTFQTLSNRPVSTTLFDPEQEEKIGHIQLAQRAKLILIAPATANFIAKISVGLADDLLSTVLLASKAKIVLAPAMNDVMWDHPTVKNNLEILKSRGIEIVNPESGFLACGTESVGRLANPEAIVSKAIQFFEQGSQADLSGKNVLITAGPTQENIDLVRYISNYSSGKMGYAIAQECLDRGAKVHLVSGPVSIRPPAGDKLELIQVKTAEEMLNACLTRLKEQDIIVKTAAVADYRIESPAEKKLKKVDEIELKLVKNKDILSELAMQKRTEQLIVGFAAESNDLERYALSKLEKKKLDMIVVNDISKDEIGFSSEDNEVSIFDKEGNRTFLKKSPKRKIASDLIDLIVSKLKLV